MGANQTLGAAGEDLAAAFLERHGMAVLERNWRCARGELDIVADDAGQVVGVEVKTRTGLGYGHPAEAVGPEKLGRLCVLIRLWCRERGRDWERARIDVVAIVLPPGGRPLIEHYRAVES